MKIKELMEGDAIDNILLVKEKRLNTAKNGSLYLSVRFIDNTGEIDAKLWDGVETYKGAFSKDDFLKVTGRVINYQGIKQIHMKHLEKIDNPDINLNEYLPASERDPNDMLKELKGWIDKLENPYLSKLLYLFYEDKKFIELFKTAPAAKSNHHAFIGGLLQHTLELASLCNDVVKYYPDINPDLLMAGAILHDSGKVYELRYSKTFSYTDDGGLIGHITIGVEMLTEKIKMIEGFPHNLEMLLKHMILSHHGHYEYGSPKRPKILESLILYYLDEMNAKADMFQRALNENREDVNWTGYNKIFERYLFKGNLK